MNFIQIHKRNKFNISETYFRVYQDGKHFLNNTAIYTEKCCYVQDTSSLRMNIVNCRTRSTVASVFSRSWLLVNFCRRASLIYKSFSLTYLCNTARERMFHSVQSGICKWRTSLNSTHNKWTNFQWVIRSRKEFSWKYIGKNLLPLNFNPSCFYQVSFVFVKILKCIY